MYVTYANCRTLIEMAGIAIDVILLIGITLFLDQGRKSVSLEKCNNCDNCFFFFFFLVLVRFLE